MEAARYCVHKNGTNNRDGPVAGRALAVGILSRLLSRGDMVLRLSRIEAHNKRILQVKVRLKLADLRRKFSRGNSLSLLSKPPLSLLSICTMMRKASHSDLMARWHSECIQRSARLSFYQCAEEGS